jgi:hypothetical protein
MLRKIANVLISKFRNIYQYLKDISRYLFSSINLYNRKNSNRIVIFGQLILFLFFIFKIIYLHNLKLKIYEI